MKGATTKHVRIGAGAEKVAASISNHAVDALARDVGEFAFVVITASDVMIAIDV